MNEDPAMPRTDAGRTLARDVNDWIRKAEAEAHAQGRAEALAAVRAAVEGLDCDRGQTPMNECRGADCALYGPGPVMYEHTLLPAAVLAAIDNLEEKP